MVYDRAVFFYEDRKELKNPMNKFKAMLFVGICFLLLLLSAYFSAVNSQEVDLDLLFFDMQAVHLGLAVLLSFAMGCVVGIGVMFPLYYVKRLRVRKVQKQSDSADKTRSRWRVQNFFKGSTN
jgi:uncharacterized integral membrane protein